MKVRLLKKVRKRYKIVYANGYHTLLDLKNKKEINCVGWESVRSHYSIYQLLVLKAMMFTLGEGMYNYLCQERYKRRQERNRVDMYNKLLNKTLHP
jgi:hypothetical protein